MTNNEYTSKVTDYKAAPCVITNKILKAIASDFSDFTNNRPYLKGIYFDNAKNCLVATEGHILLCLYTSKKQQPKENGLILSNAWVKKMIRSNDKAVIFGKAGEQGSINGIELTDFDEYETELKPPFRSKVKIPAATREGSFPEYERVIPYRFFDSDDFEEKDRICVDGRFIEAINKLRRLLEAAAVKFHHKENTASMRFDFLNSKGGLIGFAVVMPVRSC